MNKPILGSPRTVPFAVTEPDRIAAQRYYDREFFDLEREMLWPRVWQMACRLEEIPKPGNFSVYENLGESIIVTRIDENTIKAYHNHCRHRGVKLAEDRGRCTGFICPFHGWAWDLKGNCTHVFTREVFSDRQMNTDDLRLRECRVETWGGCAFINLDDNAPPLRDCIEPFATMHDIWQAEGLRVEWWYAAHLPVNWKLAMEAFMEGYHAPTTHPQTLPPGDNVRNTFYGPVPKEAQFGMAHLAIPKEPKAFDALKYTEIFYQLSKITREGMAGMLGEQDIDVMRELIGTDLPEANPLEAMATYNKKLYAAIKERNKKEKRSAPDLADVKDSEVMSLVNFCFPHFFLLPSFSASSSYRIRPLGPEECLFELWSLKRYPDGEEPPPIKTPTPMRYDDVNWPAIPKQDFANLPRQQQGLHTKRFGFMRLSEKIEGLVSNNHRVIDGYLAGLPYEKLVAAMQKVSGPIDAPIKDLGF